MAAGYKGKVAMSQGAFYAPYIPKKELTWEEKLAKWEARAKEKYGWAAGEDVKSDCMDLMQEHYPGQYVLIWSKVAPNVFKLRPVFKEPKHETMWKLKYG